VKACAPLTLPRRLYRQESSVLGLLISTSCPQSLRPRLTASQCAATRLPIEQTPPPRRVSHAARVGAFVCLGLIHSAVHSGCTSATVSEHARITRPIARVQARHLDPSKSLQPATSAACAYLCRLAFVSLGVCIGLCGSASLTVSHDPRLNGANVRFTDKMCSNKLKYVNYMK